MRSSRVPDSAEMCGYQADMSRDGKYWGCLYDESRRGMLVEADAAETAKFVKKGDWNEYRIVAKGYEFTQYINGVKTTELIDNDEKNRRADGLIALQLHQGPPMKVQFRNIRLKQDN